MKKFFIFLAALLVVASTHSVVFAQQQDCYKDFDKDSDNLYYYQKGWGAVGGDGKVWVWVSQKAYLDLGTGDRGTWSCDSNNQFAKIKTGSLPQCLLTLEAARQSSFVTRTDPNKFHVNFANSGELTLWTNFRYMVDSTQQMGSWQCGSDGKVQLSGTNGGTTNPPGQQKSENTNMPPGQQKSESTNTPSTATGTQNTDGVLKIKLNNPLKVNDLQGAIKLFMDAVIKIAIPFIVVFFIWSGLQFILAQGNPIKIATAKKMFWYTVIGTLLILGAWAITDAIVGTINSIAS